MKTSRDKTKFLNALRETPFMGHAAKKSGVARATIYRWMKSDPRFKEEVNSALKIGRDQLTDIAEMMLVQQIKKGSMQAIKFYLEHNNKRYYHKKIVAAEPPAIPKVFGPGEQCDRCGNQTLPQETIERIVEGIKDGNFDEIIKSS